MAPHPLGSLVLSSSLAGAWRAAAVALAACTAAVLVRWGLAWADAPAPWAATLAASAGAAMAGVAAWRLPRGRRQLFWTGEHWALDGLPQPVDVAIAIDLGAWILVRADERASAGHDGCTVRPTPVHRHWLPLAASGHPGAWPAARAALWTCHPLPPR